MAKTSVPKKKKRVVTKPTTKRSSKPTKVTKLTTTRKPSKPKKAKKANEGLTYYQRKKLEREKAERKAKREAKKKEIIYKVPGPVRPKIKKTVEEVVPRTAAAKALAAHMPVVEEETAPIPGKTVYLNNRELLAEVKASKKRGEMSNKLARMLQMLCAKFAKKGNFVNYSYNEDMQAYAMMMLVRTWDGFKPEVSNNAFAWYTQCVKNSFIQYLNQEKRQRVIRDLLLVDSGLNPSHSYGEGEKGVDDEEDFHANKQIADALARLPREDEILPVIIEGEATVDETPAGEDSEALKY